MKFNFLGLVELELDWRAIAAIAIALTVINVVH